MIKAVACLYFFFFILMIRMASDGEFGASVSIVMVVASVDEIQC